jgi:hypothetical protein
MQAFWLNKNESIIVSRPREKRAQDPRSHIREHGFGFGATSLMKAIDAPNTAEPKVNTALSNVRAPSRAASISPSRSLIKSVYSLSACSFDSFGMDQILYLLLREMKDLRKRT